MKAWKLCNCLFAWAALAGTGEAQTRIDLRTQGKTVDFSSAQSTLPSQIGTQLPAACQIGQTFLRTNAVAGLNWFICTAVNQWTVQGTPSVSGNATSILSTDGTSSFWQALGGDISGRPGAVTVGAILGRSLSSVAPSAGQVLSWNGSQWAPQTVTSGVSSIFGRSGAVVAQSGDYAFSQIGGTVANGQLPAAGGDLSGSLATATVKGLQGLPVGALLPSTGQVLAWSGSQWTPQNLGVPSIFGRTGAVTAQTGDYSFSQIGGAVANAQLPAAGGDLSGSLTAATVKGLQGQPVAAASPATGQILTWSGTQWGAQGAPVSSTFGRTGAVTAQTGDYSFTQIGGTVGSAQLPAAGGDLSGSLTSATVAKLQNRAMAATAPATGQVLTWNGSQWLPMSEAVPSVFGRSGAIAAQSGDYSFAQITGAATSGQLPAAGGDLSGGLTAATVKGLQGLPISTSTPASGQVLAWSGSQWAPQNVSGGVASVYGRTGTITAQNGDYTFSQIGGTVASGQLPAAGGDVSGSLTAATVTRIQNQAIGSALPSTGQALTWNGSQWVAQTAAVPSIFGRTGAITAQTGDYSFAQIAGGVASGQLPAAGGDVSGSLTSATVTRIQNEPIGATAPSSGQALTWNGSQWAPQTAAVQSIFGRTGAVVAATGDYAAAQVTNAVDATAATTYTAGARQTFQAGSSAAGIRVAPAALPNSTQAGDLAVDSADSNKVKVFNGSSWVSLTPVLPTTNFGVSFTSQTLVTILGSTHQQGTANLLVGCYDNASPANWIEPSQITIDPASFNVTVGFATAQSGRCVIAGSGGGAGAGQSGGGSTQAGMAAQLGDFAVTQSGPTGLAIGPNCSATSPCNVRFGAQVMSITGGATASISAGTGTAYIYVDTNGVLTVGNTMTVSCAGSCTAVGGITGFPLNAIPIATWTATSGTWDATGGLDRRGWLSSSNIVSGAGIVTVQTAGQTTIAVDSAVVPTFLSASATLDFPLIAAGACSADLTFSLPGANPGDAVAAGWPATLAAGLIGNMRVSAAGQIAVRLCAMGSSGIDPASATFQAVIIRGF